MNKKIIILGLALSLIPAVSNASTYHFHVKKFQAPKAVKFTRTMHYGYTIHRQARVRCAYAGCRSQIQP